MPLSPELKKIPHIASKFFYSGVAREIIASLLRGDQNRSLVEDSRRVLNEFKRTCTTRMFGLENISSGGIIVFNHPNMDIIFPGILDLMVGIFDSSGRNLRLVMASEIMLFAKLNDKTEFPGSIKFMERFHKMYGGGIISTPTVKNRKDYVVGRAVALRKIMRDLESGNLIALSPEGHIEIGGAISPIETFHWGSGTISKIAKKRGIPTIPVGFWGMENNKSVFINIGKPFYPAESSDEGTVIEMMINVAKLIPEYLRGPFKDANHNFT